ncbi:MAG TPA: heme biosynthesis HemY N-terminal domain-containing protein [Crenalkalicoccus sp.]|nr:heme biosynthesis HemY N-terminal domain-containing protein [Crenalkalicoccus sp.]
MRTAITLFVVAAIWVAVAWWVSLLPGTVSATIAGTTLETTTPVALTLFALLFLVLYGVIRFFAWLFSLPGRGRNWGQRRARVKGDTAVNRALIALAANDAGAARREAERSRRLLGDTPLTLLLAAQAGRQAGRDGEAEAAFRQLADRTDGKLLGLRGLLRLAVDRQDWEQATALAAQAEAAHPGARWLRDERRSMAMQKGEWREALRLAGPENRAALAVAAAEHDQDKAAALSYAKQAVEADPGLTPAALIYARLLRETGRAKAAKDVLRRAWSSRPHPDLAEEYVREAPDKLERSRQVGVLVQANPDNVEAYLVLARAALEAGLTGEARRHVERAIAAGINERRLWTLLADVAVMEGNAEAAQEALRHVPDADPDPVWQCTNCGTTHGSWRPVCDACQATGTVKWMHPGEAPPARLRLPRSQEIEGLTA